MLSRENDPRPARFALWLAAPVSFVVSFESLAPAYARLSDELGHGDTSLGGSAHGQLEGSLRLVLRA
jgi:hypothetical protein